MNTHRFQMDRIFLNDHLPIFGKQSGMMREQMGWCTTSYGHNVPCPQCNKETMYLHQYLKYDHNKTCCGECYSNIKFWYSPKKID